MFMRIICLCLFVPQAEGAASEEAFISQASYDEASRSYAPNSETYAPPHQAARQYAWGICFYFIVSL